MLYKTRAISLSYIKYKESSIIARLYTERFGLQSYVVNGVRSARGKSKMALFQPLTLLELVVYHRDNKDLHRISEMKCSEVFHSLPFETRKASIAIFITEVLNKILKEESENEDLFSYLHDSVLILDHLEKGEVNFHLQFLFGLAKYLGIAPGNVDTMINQIAVYDGLNKTDHSVIQQVLESKYGDVLPGINHSHRNQVLKHILAFYGHHFDHMHYSDFKSLPVLRAVLS